MAEGRETTDAVAERPVELAYRPSVGARPLKEAGPDAITHYGSPLALKAPSVF
ncbi:hypothetical protein [Streptomyces sp. NPDC005969]|uniref:hypothetical protein n=1 Tax=Streptomyces sp. NPDC005969 TaxID=3156722 RepID=UPI0033C1E71D